MCVANGQDTEEIRSRITLVRSAFSRLQSCNWSRREITLRTKGRGYQAVVRSILLYGCETWPVRVADERMLEVFDNDRIRRILRVRRRDCMPSVKLCRRLCLTRSCKTSRNAQNMDLLSTPRRRRCSQTGGQLKTRATTIKADLEPISRPRVFGHANGERTG